MAEVTTGLSFSLVFFLSQLHLFWNISINANLQDSCNNGKEHLLPLFILAPCFPVLTSVYPTYLVALHGGCPVWPGATTSEEHNHLFPQYFWLCFQHSSVEDTREMLSIFLWGFIVTEITKIVKTIPFSFHEMVYTSTESFFTLGPIQSDTYILLLFKHSIRSCLGPLVGVGWWK